MEKKRAAILTSVRNPLLKDIRKAVARGTLTSDGCAVAESFHLLEEALRSGREVRAVLAAASGLAAVEKYIGGLPETPLFVLPDELFGQIAATETSQGVIALVRPPGWDLNQLFRGRSLVVVLDGIQDPGNAGTIVRAAEAFGATGCIFVKGTVNPFNPKTLRASAGSLFRVPSISGLDPEIVRATLTQRKLDVYAAMPRGGKSLAEVNLTHRVALIVGSEGRGVSERLRSCALDLHIPTAGVESLNAAMAAGIVLYEACRQRKLN